MYVILKDGVWFVVSLSATSFLNNLNKGGSDLVGLFEMYGPIHMERSLEVGNVYVVCPDDDAQCQIKG